MARIHELVAKHFKYSISISKKMIQVYGTDAAVMMGELMSKQQYWYDAGRLQDGRFFWSVRDIMLTTGLKRWVIEKTIATLADAGFIEVKTIPQKITLYRVNIDAVDNFLDNTEVKRGKEFYRDTVLPVTQHLTEQTIPDNPTVLVPTQNCASTNTGGVLVPAHTNPFTKPSKSTAHNSFSSDEDQKPVNDTTRLYETYRELFYQTTGAYPNLNRKEANAIFKRLADNSGADNVERGMYYFFKDAWVRENRPGFPLPLFAKQADNFINKHQLNNNGYRKFGQVCPKCQKDTYADQRNCPDCGEVVNKTAPRKTLTSEDVERERQKRLKELGWG